MLVVALVLFVAISVTSFSSLPTGNDVRWGLLAVIVFLVNPWMLMANAAEYRAMARIAGHDVPWPGALRLTVIASAANLFPLPGGVLVRTQALRARGSSYRHALAVNGAAGLVWIGCGALIIAALSLQGPTTWALGAAATATGLCALAASVIIIRRIRHDSVGPTFAVLVAVESVTVGLSALRIYLAFQFLGLSATPAEAIALSASIIVAAAIGIFPAGLGLREVLAGLIGASIGVGPSVAVAATAVDRICGLMTTGFVTGFLVFRDHARRRVTSPFHARRHNEKGHDDRAR